jgi:glycine betaine/choline ABC-type transport system substrate-binding protein
MTRRVVVWILLLTCATLPVSCGQKEPVRIASKSFAENRILGEMFALLAQEEGIPVERNIPYGNTFDLQEAIKEGRVDVYPEYTGTGLAMMGVPAVSEEDEALRTVKELFRRFDLAWLDRLGFNNSYVLAMQSDQAVRMDVSRIGDLAGKTGEVRIGCEEEFLVRPVDGFPALVRRYGFSPEPETVVASSREDLYRKLVAGRIEVAVVQRTDPQIEEFNLTLLEDNLNFFPAYQGAPLVREAALQDHPGLGGVLGLLDGRISNGTMRELNRAVELDGLEARAVAAGFLVREGLLERDPPELERRVLTVAVPPADQRSRMLAQALEAVRRVFPNRRVEVSFTSDPGEELYGGRAFIALLGAEHFFSVSPGGLPEVRDDVEAVAPVGHRVVHLIRRRSDLRKDPFKGVRTLGVGPEGGSSAQVADILTDAYAVEKRTEPVFGKVSKQASDVGKGRLDALLVMAAPGDAEIMIVLESRRLALQPISGWNRSDRQYRYPFFRLARIPAALYPGLDENLETVSSQVVLAGPRPEAPAIGDGDPVSGLRARRQRLPKGVKKSLIDALGIKEAIDPALPGETVSVVTARRDVVPVNPSPAVSVLTALFFLALGGFFYLLSRAADGRGG